MGTIIIGEAGNDQPTYHSAMKKKIRNIVTCKDNYMGGGKE